MKFIICSFDYDQRSGGIIALHKLGKDLADFGHSVNLFAKKTIPGSKCQLLTQHEIYKLITDDPEHTVVYPEIVKGNPWCAKNVVRWVLYHPGIHGGDKEYDPDELVLTYSPLFVKGTKYEQCPVLFTFTSGLDDFKDLDVNRAGDCLLIKKGHHKEKPVDIEPIDQFIKTSSDLNGDLLQLFNQHERFISLDHASYHSVQAALCGCISIVIPEEGITKEEWCEKLPLFRYGIAYGMDDIEWAINTRELMVDNLKAQDAQSKETILNLIHILERRMKPSIFVITSALSLEGAPKGNLEERIFQTLGTVYSIMANVKKAEIWIIDASHAELHPSIYRMFPESVKFFKINEFNSSEISKIRITAEVITKHLKSKYVIKDNKDSEDIHTTIYNAYIKSKTELFMINKFLENIDASNYNRFYKISGRYMVSSQFDQTLYDNCIDGITLAKKKSSMSHIPEYEYQHWSMLWSFDSTLFEDVKSALIKCESWLDDNFINQRKVVDIEHSFYQFFTKAGLKVFEVDKIGVVGIVNNQNKKFIYN